MILDDTYASYVNLDHREDRLERMWKTLDEVGIDAVRTRGMYPEEYSGDPGRVRVMRERTPGAIGCYFSQMRILADALSRNQHALVLEDDLVFCEDFHQRLAIFEEFTHDHPWDILWLGATFHVNPPEWHKQLGRDAELTDHPRIVRTYGAFSTHAYLVNRAYIEAILKRLDELVPSSMGIDWSMIQMQPDLFSYSFVPGMVKQYDNQSDIGGGLTLFSGFAKLGPYWWQPRMEDFDPASFDWAEAAR